MGIGKFTKRVKIYEITPGVSDGIGGTTTVKTLVKTCWAQVEQLQQSKAEGQILKPIEINIRAGSYELTTENLIEYNNQDYTVLSIATDPKKRITNVTGARNGS